MENIDYNRSDAYSTARRRMVEEQLLARDIRDRSVLNTMTRVPRHLFVDEALHSQAYGDYPLGIGCGQTISQPYMVAFMTQALQLVGSEKMLEIGTGCGYQTAVLAEIANQVYTIERIKTLGLMGRRHLKRLGYRNVCIRIGDGTKGWPDAAPFDGIIITAGSPDIPLPLVEQLREGGRLVVPVGPEDTQSLKRVTKKKGCIDVEDLGLCRFVKLVGKHGWSKQRRAGDRFVKRSLI